MKTLLLLTALLISTQALAGAEGVGGGDGYVCPTHNDNYPYKEVRLVDTYGDTSLDGIVQDNALALIDPFGMRTLARYLNREMPAAVYPHPYKASVKIQFGTLVLLRYLSLEFQSRDLSRLPDLPDDHIAAGQVPRGCQKIQLAIQDLKTSTIRMSESTQYLPVIDDLFLRLHETMISLRNQPGLDTTPVRRDVKRLADMVRFHRADFVKSLTSDFEKAMTVPEPTPALTIAKNLRCQMTWKSPLIDKHQTLFALPPTFWITRVQGSGRPGEKNVYQLKVASGASALSSSAQVLQQPTIYSSTIASKINAVQMKFKGSRGVTYEIDLYDHISEAGVYNASATGSYSDTSVSTGLMCVPM